MKTFEIKLRQDKGFESPSLQFGAGAIQYRMSSQFGSELELGKIRWNHKYPRDFYHEDEIHDLEIDFERYYNVSDD